VGYKQNFGRTFSIDTALFYYDYDDFQLPIAVNNGGTIQTNFINVPKANSTGIEIESTWTPVRDLLLTLSYSLDYTSVLTGCSGTVTGGVLTPSKGSLCTIDTNDPAAVQRGAKPYPGQVYNATSNPGIFQSIKGNPLPDAPRNKIAVTGSYTWHFDPGAFTLSATYVWRDVQDGAQFNRPYDNAPSWDDFDLRAVWVGPHDKYEISGYVKNVFNTAQYTNGVTGAGLLGTASSFTTAARGLDEVNVYALAPPRTFGVELRYKFF
jgi:iron complex outermembrane receptor protein